MEISIYFKGILDALYISPGDTVLNKPILLYYITLVEINDAFKSKLKKAYKKNERWKRILNIVKGLNTIDAILSYGL